MHTDITFFKNCMYVYIHACTHTCIDKNGLEVCIPALKNSYICKMGFCGGESFYFLLYVFLPFYIWILKGKDVFLRQVLLF